MPEPSLIPPGHGEYEGPGIQFRCPECGEILSRMEPDEGVWVGWCQFHGHVEPVSSDSQSENDEEDLYE